MTIKIDANGYDAITFDCYGTLIDWEAGLMSYIKPLLEAHDAHAVDSFVLDFYGRTESKLQAGPYRPYRQILAGRAAGAGRTAGLPPLCRCVGGFPDSIGDWMPFPDTIASLKALGPRFQLVVVSNIDDDLFDLTQARLNVNFDHVITAAQVGAYKPDPRPFKAAIERIGVPQRADSARGAEPLSRHCTGESARARHGVDRSPRRSRQRRNACIRRGAEVGVAEPRRAGGSAVLAIGSGRQKPRVRRRAHRWCSGRSIRFRAEVRSAPATRPAPATPPLSVRAIRR